jgi:hypothetical protein
LATLLERPQAFTASLPTDAKEAANSAGPQPFPARENGHGPVAVRQAALIEVAKQGREIGNIPDITGQRIRADILL